MNFINSIPYNNKESGTSSSNLDYFLKIRNFLTVTCDYTEIIYDDSNTELYLVVKKEDVYYHFTTYTGTSLTGISHYCSYSYDNTQGFYNQNSKPIFTFSIPTDSDIKQYYFYANSRNFIIVTEFQFGKYAYLLSGKFTSLGNHTNLYMSGNLKIEANNNSDVQSQYKSLFSTPKDNSVLYLNNSVLDYDGFSSSIFDANFGIDYDFLKNSKIKFNDKGLLFTPFICKKYSTLYSPALELSDVFACNKDYFNVGEVFYLGSREFITFPMYEKEVPGDFNDQKSKCLNIAIRTL